MAGRFFRLLQLIKKQKKSYLLFKMAHKQPVAHSMIGKNLNTIDMKKVILSGYQTFGEDGTPVF